jgi:hypothetical protein
MPLFAAALSVALLPSSALHDAVRPSLAAALPAARPHGPPVMMAKRSSRRAARRKAKQEEEAGYAAPAAAGNLPPGYQQQIDPASGNPFYVNLQTGETSWQPPAAVAPPPQPAAMPTADGTMQMPSDEPFTVADEEQDLVASFVQVHAPSDRSDAAPQPPTATALTRASVHTHTGQARRDASVV